MTFSFFSDYYLTIKSYLINSPFYVGLSSNFRCHYLYVCDCCRMVTPWRMAYMLATKLAPFPGPVCRHASRGAYGRMSPRYSDSHSKQKQQEDMFEDDHDMDAVEAKLNSIIRWVLLQSGAQTQIPQSSCIKMISCAVKRREGVKQQSFT